MAVGEKLLVFAILNASTTVEGSGWKIDRSVVLWCVDKGWLSSQRSSWPVGSFRGEFTSKTKI